MKKDYGSDVSGNKKPYKIKTEITRPTQQNRGTNKFFYLSPDGVGSLTPRSHAKAVHRTFCSLPGAKCMIDGTLIGSIVTEAISGSTTNIMMLQINVCMPQ